MLTHAHSAVSKFNVKPPGAHVPITKGGGMKQDQYLKLVLKLS